MRRHRITTVCAMAGVLSTFVMTFTLYAQQREKFTDFRGKGFSTEDLERALSPTEMRTRGLPQTPSLPPPERVSVAFDVLYEFNSNQILPRYYVNLDKLGEVLKRRPEYRLQIEGHTDNVGSEDYNQRLSQRRAASVKQYLMQHFSVAPERLAIVGYGKNKPRTTNDTAEGRGENRRVEFVNLGQ